MLTRATKTAVSTIVHCTCSLMNAYTGPSSHNCQCRHHPQTKLLRLPRNTPLKTPTHKGMYETGYSEQVLQVTCSVYSQTLNSGSISANAFKGTVFFLARKMATVSLALSSKEGHTHEKYSLIKLLKKHHQ